MLDEVTSRRQAAVALSFQAEHLLKQSSSQVTAEQTDNLEAVMDDVRHRLNTVSSAFISAFSILPLHVCDACNPTLPLHMDDTCHRMIID